MLQKSLFNVQVIDLSQKRNLSSTVLSYEMNEFNGVSQNNLPLFFSVGMEYDKEHYTRK